MADSGCEDTVPTMSSMVPSCKLPEESDASMRARLFTSLSQSFPHSQLYKALHGGEDINLNGGDNSEDDDDDSLYGDHLSNSCFASLRMDRRDSDDFDDDLRSLEWLQNEDLLKNIGGEKLDKEDDDNEEQKENEDIKPDISLLQGAPGQQPSNISYLPQKHVNSKPPYSFSCLIFMAVEASPQKRLPVKDIYNWILTQFPYFQNAPTGWKNSVRHNLSLNKCFKKVEKIKASIGKGSLWCIDPAYRPNLLQALRKTPYHPYHQLQMTSTQPQNYIQYQSLPGGGRTVLPLTQRPVPNTVSPHLFPFLSRRLAQTSFDVDNEMKDVAQTLVALKGSYRKESPDSSSGEDIGPTWRHHKKSLRRPSSPVVVTGHPYDDHSYSSTRVLDEESLSSSSSIDEEYDFGDADEECDSEYHSDMDWDSDNKDDVDGDLPSNKKLKIDMRVEGGSTSSGKGIPATVESDDDEQKKIHEGASALLNLAGLLLNHRNNSASPEASTPEKKKDNYSEKEKTGEKKRRSSKKVRDVGKKSVMLNQKKEVDEGQRKRSVSKRKNAGSNGKYQTGEYSLIKPGKTVTKSPSSSLNVRKSVKAETPKSSGDADSDKAAGSTSKKKPIKNSASKKVIKKGSSGKQKLKLSKTFGTSSKLVNSLTDKNTPVADKTPKNISQNSKSKKGLPKKGAYKSMQSSVSKRIKTNTGNTNSSKISSAHENGSISSAHVSSKPSSSSESVNNNSIRGTGIVEKLDILNDVLSANSEHIQGGKKNLSDSFINKGQPSAVSPFLNGKIISPAGDAPAKSKETPTTAEVDTLSETRLSTELSPSVAPSSSNSSNESTHDDVSKQVGSKNSPNRRNVSDIPSAAALHKSPHFTRFSKKKAALS